MTDQTTRPTTDSNRGDIFARDASVSFRQLNSTPASLAIAYAEGIWVTDCSGRLYRDFYGNNCHNLGHMHPKVIAAVRAQLERHALVPRGLTSSPAVELAEHLTSAYPFSDTKVLLAPTGSSAVEIALTIAKANTGRFKTVSFYDAYHGRSAGALSVGGAARDRSSRLGPLMPGALHVQPFYWQVRHEKITAESLRRSADSSLQMLEDILSVHPDIAALIGEPIRNGPFAPPTSYWRDVKEICERHGVLLIFDEVPMGLGRTGRLFNCEHFGVRPNMTVIGKSLGGGLLPIASVIADSSLDTTPELNLSYYTHEKNALSASAGLATIKVLIEQKLAERSDALGKRIEQWAQQTSVGPSVIDIRCCGMTIGIEFGGSSFAEAAGVANSMRECLLQRGIISMPSRGTLLTMSIPLVIDTAELEKALDDLSSVLNDPAQH